MERKAASAFGPRDHLVVDRRGRGRDEVVVGKPALAQNGGQRLLPEIAFKWIVWVWHGDEVFDKCVLSGMKVITPLLATQAPGNRSSRRGATSNTFRPDLKHPRRLDR